MTSTVTVLGSSAGGGLPQWNCGCHNCALVRAGQLVARTQDSIALRTAHGILLVNASPDIAAQLALWRLAHPTSPRLEATIDVVLTNGDLDHVLGLLTLRENQPIVVHSTDAVRAGLLERNVVFRTLQRFRGQLEWRTFELDRDFAIGDVAIRPRALPGKLPVHLEGIAAPSVQDNVALWIRQGSQTIVYASAVAYVDDPSLFDGVEVLLFDGTFFTDDELIRMGVGRARAADMAHLPISGPSGSMVLLANAKVGRKIFTHINNTNPILDPAFARREIEPAGWEIAFDGMEIDP